jgi:hypothetical protein
MIRISKKLALAASLTAVVVGLGTGVAFAAGDTDDSISPASTAFTANNSTNIVFKGNVNGFPVTVTCKNSSISGSTPASGLGPVNINNPTFSGCTDSLGGTDTITTNSTNGHWQLTFLDSTATGEETQTEPNSGDSLQVTIPKGGATFTSTALPGCVITVTVTVTVIITGTYDDVSIVVFTNVSISVKGAGCVAASFSISGSYKSTTNFHDAS